MASPMSIKTPRSSTPPRKPARTAAQVPSPSKWGEVVSSLPVVRLSEQSSLGSPSKHLGFSPQVGFGDASLSLWSPEPLAKPKAPGQSALASEFWRTHERYALQRSREAARQAEIKKHSEETPQTTRNETTIQSETQVHWKPGVQLSPSLEAYLPPTLATRSEPLTLPVAPAEAHPSQVQAPPRKQPPPAEEAYEQLLEGLARRLAASPAEDRAKDSAAQRMAAAARGSQRPGTMQRQLPLPSPGQRTPGASRTRNRSTCAVWKRC
ncbi:unnamed protein product [Symbiodinium sp. CCMP2456]|nr:unnamed protein product [Symbiodinium sp. CCMP2456]